MRISDWSSDVCSSDAMPIILDLETREIRAGLKCPKPQIACRDDGSLETSGSGIARIETNGASAGTIDPLVADAASARALAAVRLTHHQSDRKSTRLNSSH